MELPCDGSSVRTGLEVLVGCLCRRSDLLRWPATPLRLPFPSLFPILLLLRRGVWESGISEFMMSKADLSSSSDSDCRFPLPSDLRCLLFSLFSALLAFHSVTVVGRPCLLGLGCNFWQRSEEVPGDEMSISSEPIMSTQDQGIRRSSRRISKPILKEAKDDSSSDSDDKNDENSGKN